jgi:hypothetical protein
MLSIGFTPLVLMKAKLINTMNPVVVNTNTLERFNDERTEINLSTCASFCLNGLSRC